MKIKKVLLVGLRTSSVDFAKWPELTPEKLEAAFETVESGLKALGHTPTWCLTDDGDTAEQELREALLQFEPDIISIGAGIRADPNHLQLFETLVNLAHSMAPNAKFAFNTNPIDTVASVQRLT